MTQPQAQISNAVFSKKNGKLLFIIGLTVMILLLGLALWMIVRLDARRDAVILANSSVVLVLMLFAMLLFICCSIGAYSRYRQTILFFSMILVDYVLTFLNLPAYLLVGRADCISGIYTVHTLIGFITPTFWMLFWLYLREGFPRRRVDRILSFILCGVLAAYILLTILNLFFDILFTVDAQGFVLVKYKNLINLLFSCAVLSLFITYIFTLRIPLKKKLALNGYLLFPILGLFFAVLRLLSIIRQPLEGPSLLIELVPLYLIFFNIYTERGQKLAEQEIALTESQLNCMILRINPHFIYNTLGSIDSLCLTDPEKAAMLTRMFAKYLRDNDKSMSAQPMIPFRDEIEHLDHYLAIEQVRFPNLRVEYDLEVMGFLIPSLSVQPLVENAIRHGIRKRRFRAGTVIISSQETSDEFVVRVEDDGVGFVVLPNDAQKHIGIANVRTRLEMLCHGTLTVNSRPEIGTVCEIRIPKKEEYEDDRTVR